MNRRNFLIIPAIPLLASLAHSADESQPQAGADNGVICVAPAGDGAEALALAKRPGPIVYAMDPDPAKVRALRKKAVEAGVLGRSLYVDVGTPDRLPLADNVADRVVASPATPEAEVLRVLTPVTGRATVGGKTLTKPALPGADDWTHRFHGPDNNPVSGDTAFRMPSMLQFLGLPMQTSFQGVTLVAGSRRVELTDWVIKAPDRNPVAGKLRVRSGEGSMAGEAGSAVARAGRPQHAADGMARPPDTAGHCGRSRVLRRQRRVRAGGKARRR